MKREEAQNNSLGDLALGLYLLLCTSHIYVCIGPQSQYRWWQLIYWPHQACAVRFSCRKGKLRHRLTHILDSLWALESLIQIKLILKWPGHKTPSKTRVLSAYYLDYHLYCSIIVFSQGSYVFLTVLFLENTINNLKKCSQFSIYLKGENQNKVDIVKSSQIKIFTITFLAFKPILKSYFLMKTFFLK